jgi:hypothetical protein
MKGLIAQMFWIVKGNPLIFAKDNLEHGKGGLARILKARRKI